MREIESALEAASDVSSLCWAEGLALYPQDVTGTHGDALVSLDGDGLSARNELSVSTGSWHETMVESP